MWKMRTALLAGLILVSSPVFAASADQQADFARRVESDFLDQNIDVHVSAQDNVLMIRGALLGRLMVRQIVRSDLPNLARDNGFRSITFDDGIGGWWVYDVQNGGFTTPF
jgi:hypothetical protein